MNPPPISRRLERVGQVPKSGRILNSCDSLVLLGHTTEGEQNDGELTPRNLRECEAESVALLCCAALDLPGVECSRGYIQSWWGQGNAIPEKSAQRILKVADQILKAGNQSGVEAES